METIDTEERRKIADMVKMKKDGRGGGSMDWMYSSKQDNSEEYLLGKKIDKHFEKGNESPAKEDDIFGERIRANIALDMQAKMREDPLYSIKKREEESRKKILHNPVRMKELQHMIAQQKKERKEKKKKSKKKRKQGQGEEEDILVQRYLSILSHKHGQQGHASARARSSSSDSLSDHTSDRTGRRQQEKKGRSHPRYEKEGRDQAAIRHYGLIKSQHHEDIPNPKFHSRCRSRSPAERSQQSDGNQKGERKAHRDSGHPRPSDKLSTRPRTHHSKHSSSKMSTEERERRLQEMRDNATWREEQRRSNVQRYAAEEKRTERQDAERRRKKGGHAGSADFLNPLMSEHARNSTVEDRLKRNKYNIQRTNAALDKDFTKH